MAQSIAGGGGNGAINVSAGISGSASGSAGSFVLGLGGFGGDGGTAGDVYATVGGNISATGHGEATTTAGRTVEITDLTDPNNRTLVAIPALRTIKDGSSGVIAQSVGGGGGNGGMNISGGVSLDFGGGTSRALTIGVGGFGGGGGDAGAVDLTVEGPSQDRFQIVSVGDERYAVAAQSIGGGGGNGGFNISGGVSLAGNLTIGVGGFGGGGGKGKAVAADVIADLFATGERSRGLLVQSVGGGGGAGGFNISGGLQPDSDAREPSATFGLGGSGGAGNISGDVVASQSGSIWVEGVSSIGALVQSVAGGGGDGGFNISTDITLAGDANSRGFAIAAGIGGTGGTGADATSSSTANSRPTPPRTRTR